MKRYLLLLATALVLVNCSKDKNPGDTNFNIFSVEDDIAFGKQTDSAILADPATYPVLNRAQNPQAYGYIEGIRNTILNSGKVFYKDRFAWEVKIINDDNTLNAFCTPGGYIYVYTGLMKYLDSEDQLAGVLGHEMAHADRRHSTDQLTKQYTLSTLIQILLGKNPSQFAEIAASLTFLKFERAQETEADTYSVTYLCPTDYNAAGAAGFFSKLKESGQSGQTPVFLSTHPGDAERVDNIKAKKASMGCTGTATKTAEYQAFLNTLPN